MLQSVRQFHRQITGLLIIGACLAGDAYASSPEWLSTLPGPEQISALAVDPAQPSRIYAGAAPATVFTSTDSGLTWVKAAIADRGGAVSVIAPDPHTPGQAYLGLYWGGLCKTTDGGQTWGPMEFDLPGETRAPEPLVLVVDRADPRVLYLGTRGRFEGDSWSPTRVSGRLWKSADGGQSWKDASNGLDLASSSLSPTDIAAIAINSLEPKKLYLATTNGIYGSSDHGDTWTRLSAPAIMSVGLVSVSLTADPRNWDVVYLTQNYPATAGFPIPGIQKSTDGGRTWQEATRGLQSDDIASLAIDPADPERLYVSTGSLLGPDYGRIYVSLNGAESWDPFDPPLAYPARSLAFGGQDLDRLYAAAWGVQQITLRRQDRFYFPHLGSGKAAGWELQTEITLVNMGPETQVTLEFFDPQGTPLALSFGDRVPGSALDLTLKTGQIFSERTTSSSALAVGYAVVTAPPGVTGSLVFSCSRDGRNLYETGVPAVRGLNRNFTLFVDAESEASDVGLALTNAGSGDATVALKLYDENFGLISSRPLSQVIGQQFRPGSQVSRYAKEIFPEIRDRGLTRAVITVESDQDLAAMTLHQRTEGADVRVSTFPVIPNRADQDLLPTGEPPIDFAHIVNGEVAGEFLKTEVVLLNASIEGTVNGVFRNIHGLPMELELEGYGRVSEFSIDLARGQVVVLKTTGHGVFQTGWLQLHPRGDIHAITLVTQANAVSSTEAAIHPSELREFSFFFDASDPRLDTGFAVVAPPGRVTNVTLALFDESGTMVANRQTQWVPLQKLAQFATELFPEIGEKGIKRGVVSISTNQFVFATILRQHQVPLPGLPEYAYRLTTLPLLPRVLE